MSPLAPALLAFYILVNESMLSSSRRNKWPTASQVLPFLWTESQSIWPIEIS